MQTSGTNETTSNGSAGSSEQSKDTLIFVKSKSVGEDSKGRTKLDLRFSEEETKQLIAELSKINSRVKLQIHYSEETAFLFVKEVQEKGATFVKKVEAKKPGSDTAAKVAALKGK